MLDELQRRNYLTGTIHSYIRAVEDFAKYFGKSPYQLGLDHIRQYQAPLFRDRKLLAGTIQIKTAALRFLNVKTLRRPYLHEHIPFPKRVNLLPTAPGRLASAQIAFRWDVSGITDHGHGRTQYCDILLGRSAHEWFPHVCVQFCLFRFSRFDCCCSTCLCSEGQCRAGAPSGDSSRENLFQLPWDDVCPMESQPAWR